MIVDGLLDFWNLVVNFIYFCQVSRQAKTDFLSCVHVVILSLEAGFNPFWLRGSLFHRFQRLLRFHVYINENSEFILFISDRMEDLTFLGTGTGALQPSSHPAAQQTSHLASRQAT